MNTVSARPQDCPGVTFTGLYRHRSKLWKNLYKSVLDLGYMHYTVREAVTRDVEIRKLALDVTRLRKDIGSKKFFYLQYYTVFFKNSHA